MIIAVEGCAHGELEIIYETLAFLEKQQKVKVDLLLCCGDFQSTRNLSDLQCMAVPDKFKSMCSFYKYYSGEKTAPVLTIFIGGNHEASNYLGELAYGGWVAPNIYYLGYAGVVNVKGVKIAGMSGIFKGRDYMKGHFERPPYDKKQIRSAYHIRNLEVFRLKQLSQPLDIILSHDWPLGVHNFGDVEKLLKVKPFFRQDIEENALGSKPAEELLHHLKPSYWFSAHLHCKFAAVVEHSKQPKKTTKFLALDKCLPKRKYLQILDIPSDDEQPLELKYDLEWLTILHFTNHLLSVENSITYMPGPTWPKRWNFTPTQEEKDFILKKFNSDLRVPENFARTVNPFDPSQPKGRVFQPQAQINPQTMSFCERLGIDDPMALLLDTAINTSQASSQVSSCSWPADRSTGSSAGFAADGLSCSQDMPEPPLADGEMKWFVDTTSSSENLQNKTEEKAACVSKGTGALKRLSGLSLPPPSNIGSSESSETPSKPLTPYKSPMSYDSPLSQMSPTSTSKGEEEDGTPAVKRTFKRRNQSIYASNDDD